MTLKAELARQDAARSYAAGSVMSAEAYRTKALAVQAAQDHAEATQAAADRAASLPVIVGGTVNNLTVAPAGNVTVARASHDAPDARTTSAPVPLAAANVDAWVADESRFDPEGVKALQNEWAGDMGANLGYVRHWLHTTFTPEQREQAEAANILSVPVIRFIAQVAREGAHAAPTATTTATKGQPTMAETLSRPDAMKQFRKLTADLHSARARQDRLLANELAAERDALSQALFPGDGSPDADHSGRVIG